MSFLAILQDAPLILIGYVAAIGLMVGSFLNVVIHRLPKMMQREWEQQCAELRGETVKPAPKYNIATPRSACAHCGHKITVLENIPVLSYLLLGGRCSNCKKRISARYPVIEIITALLSGGVAWHFGYSLLMPAALIFVWALIVLTMIDFDTQLLPDDITFPLLWIGLLVNMHNSFTSLPSAVIGAVAGYLSLWLVYWCFKLATGKEGMGHGDFKLLAAIGAWLGWSMLPLVILLSSLVGAVIGIGLIIVTRRKESIPIPFGPYLSGGALIALFWGEEINNTYLGIL